MRTSLADAYVQEQVTRCATLSETIAACDRAEWLLLERATTADHCTSVKSGDEYRADAHEFAGLATACRRLLGRTA